MKYFSYIAYALFGIILFAGFVQIVGLQSALESQQWTINAIQTKTDEALNVMDLKIDDGSFGSVNAVAGIPYYLYGSGVGTTDTSLTLTSFKQPVSGYKLTMTDFGDIGYLTLEPGSATRQEFVSFAGVTQNTDGTATLTGLVRGLGFVSPFTASSTLQKAHGGGTSAVISNPPQFYERFGNKLNDQQITGIWGFSALPTSSVTCSQDVQFCNKQYIDAGFNAGGATSTFTRIGYVQIATDKQVASSTASSTAGAPLVLLAKFATTTPSVTCSTGIWNCVPVANSAGKLAQSWLNLAEGFSFSSGVTSTAATALTGSTTIAANSSNKLTLNGVSYIFPPIPAASSTNLSFNGSGSMFWTAPQINVIASQTTTGASTASTASTTVASITLPASSLTTSRQLRVTANFVTDSAQGSCNYSLGLGNGTATSTIAFVSSVNNAEGAIISGTIFATTTLSEGSNFIGQETAYNTASANVAWWGLLKYSPYTITSQLYIQVVAQSSATFTPTCRYVGATVEAIAQ